MKFVSDFKIKNVKGTETMFLPRKKYGHCKDNGKSDLRSYIKDNVHIKVSREKVIVNPS